MITIAYECARLFSSMTGFGTYCRTLISNLSAYYPNNHYLLISSDSHRYLSAQKTFELEEIDRILQTKSVRALFPPERWSIYWKAFGARKALNSNGVDIYHGPTQHIPRSIRETRIPKIITMHDLIYRHYPELCPGQDLDALDRQLSRACSVSDRIIAVSQSTKIDLVNLFSISPDKISVIYSACDTRYGNKVPEHIRIRIKEKYHLPDRYLLYVGSMTERKNLLSIVDAINRLPVNKRLPLVVIGDMTSYTDKVLNFSDKNKIREWLIFPSNVSTNELPAVYQGAELFIYPSLYEGFGMPVLEALTSGVPVITSNVSAMPEAGGPNTRLINPTDVDEIAWGIEEIVGDSELRGTMILAGKEHAKRFSGEVVTNQIFNLYINEIHKYR